MALTYLPVLENLQLVADPVAALLRQWNGITPVSSLEVAAIDPDLADTAACCEKYGLGMEDSVNCVVIAGKRGDEVRFAACLVLATTRADVNGVIRKRLDARKASFASMNEAVTRTRMEYGGITPFGLPSAWPILIDSRVVGRERAVFGSGLRASKLFGPGCILQDLPNAEVIENLAS